MKLSDFDYHLPKELIAQEGLADRDDARLMVLDRAGGLSHSLVRDLPEILKPGDLLVLNDTRVIPAKLLGRKVSGGKVDCLVLPAPPPPGRPDVREALLRGSRVRPGIKLLFKDGNGLVLTASVLERAAGARYLVEFSDPAAIGKMGSLPLPPYIKRPLAEPSRYQTVFSKNDGSLAAPTAGLHFTDRLLDRLKERGVETAFLTLHVGVGTFAPIRTATVEDWTLHEEYFRIGAGAAERINLAAREGRRVFAVGTTAVRALESALVVGGTLAPKEGWTDIYIYPGYRFKLPYAGLLTNFHLPKSSLLLLASAFAGRERILSAYREAIVKRYRFYSFGDAMLIFRDL
ncbi:MAG: tRNA preQ1(34) S-adenosylmethionine ribosyltransferase-isomerase QueA [Elusimicrobia bacterium RIFCSPLOWO2_01_FULL_64_13]|nr:MAG: tRNA preQ1(34) S-adenosylmethionine ribosyltransferase-isomerase QueA [Elusimicrobia bacterium RIFCSPLOWO2_01_FULL_64_13]